MNLPLTILSIAALIASMAALVFSLTARAGQRRAERERRDLRELQIVQEMRKRVRDLLEAFRERPDDRALKEAYLDASEDLARAYEDVCREYYEDDLDREWFIGMYGRDIVSWVDSGPLREEFSRRLPRYAYTGRASRELRRVYRAR